MPVVTKGVQVSRGQAAFTWEQAYKFDDDTLRYDFTFIYFIIYLLFITCSAFKGSLTFIMRGATPLLEYP